MRWRTIVEIAVCVGLSLAVPSLVRAGGGFEGTVDARVHHVATYEDGVVRWQSTLPVDLATEDGRVRPLAFRFPIPRSSEFPEARRVETTGESRAREGDEADGKRTKRVRLTDPEHDEMVLEVTREWRPGSGEPLKPPLVRGAGLQRVSLRGVRYYPGEGVGLERYPGYIGPRGLARDPDDQFAFEPEPGVEEVEQIVYVRPTELPDGGLAGDYQASESIKMRTMWVLGGFGVLLMFVGVAAYRWLERPAREEEAEAILAEHGESLDLE